MLSGPDAERPGRRGSEIDESDKAGRDGDERRVDRREKSLAGLRRRDATRRAGEQAKPSRVGQRRGRILDGGCGPLQSIY